MRRATTYRIITLALGLWLTAIGLVSCVRSADQVAQDMDVTPDVAPSGGTPSSTSPGTSTPATTGKPASAKPALTAKVKAEMIDTAVYFTFEITGAAGQEMNVSEVRMPDGSQPAPPTATIYDAKGNAIHTFQFAYG